MMVRLVLSLLFVAAVLLLAARVAKKRGMGGSGLVEVLGRHPLSRTGSVNVVRVADRVFLLGTTETHISLLAEMDEAEVESAMATTEDGAAAKRPVPVSTGPLAGSVFDRAQWAGFVNSLREKTVRRG